MSDNTSVAPEQDDIDKFIDYWADLDEGQEDIDRKLCRDDLKKIIAAARQDAELTKETMLYEELFSIHMHATWNQEGNEEYRTTMMDWLKRELHTIHAIHAQLRHTTTTEDGDDE